MSVCKHSDCQKRPTYNLEAEFCASYETREMIDVSRATRNRLMVGLKKRSTVLVTVK